MSTSNQPTPAELVANLLAIDVEQLVKPISEQEPSGPYLKYEEVYFDIQKARTQDETFLPRGVWEHDLKKAEWHQVTSLCVDTLQKRSKDLQVAMWLLEAAIHRFGFDGLAAGLWITQQLCQHFWPDIHPQVEHDDIEYRINPLVWAADKLLPAIRLIPLMSGDERKEHINWSDWIYANEAAEKGEVSKGAHVDAAYILNLLSRIESDAIKKYLGSVELAITQLQLLDQTLDELLGDQGPSFRNMLELIKDIQYFLHEELQRRGALLPEITHAQAGEAEQEADDQDIPSIDEQVNGTRNEAYRQVEQAARALLQFDPHSPAPYLILQACRWGTMDTRELYRELFVECGGQLNIFELLGVQSPSEGANS